MASDGSFKMPGLRWLIIGLVFFATLFGARSVDHKGSKPLKYGVWRHRNVVYAGLYDQPEPFGKVV